jgi:hypothetical protein
MVSQLGLKLRPVLSNDLESKEQKEQRKKNREKEQRHPHLIKYPT